MPDADNLFPLVTTRLKLKVPPQAAAASAAQR